MGRYVIGLKDFHILKERLKLSAEQESIVIGSILGDGCLQVSKKGNSARLQIRNSSRHSGYVKWKYQFLSEWSPRGLISDAPKVLEGKFRHYDENLP